MSEYYHDQILFLNFGVAEYTRLKVGVLSILSFSKVDGLY